MNTKLDDTSFWMLKSVSEEEQSYKSNDGYADEIKIKYVYDDSVPNHKQIKSGDIAAIVNKEKVLGLVKISRILISNKEKERRRCPICGNTNYEKRKTKLPEYRCNQGHEFDNPKSEVVDVIQFEAYYSDSFRLPLNTVTVDKLRPYFKNNYNRNMSMQRLDERFFTEFFPKELIDLSDTFVYPAADEAEHFFSDLLGDHYTPNTDDEREKIFRSIMQRRGQKNFRDSIRELYGNKCMITGCEVLEVLEAAHINPYRGEKDNHVSNGLLLRSDIHTLFDLDLIGIEPEKFIIHLSASVQKDEYIKFSGTKLKIHSRKNKPNEKALKLRWEKFKSSNIL